MFSRRRVQISSDECVRARLLSDVRHLLQEGRLPAARAELIHPQRSLVLQRGAAGVERVGGVVVQETAEGRHVDV